MSQTVTLSIAWPAADITALAVTNSGGSIAANTYSGALVTVYHPTGNEADLDRAGIQRVSPFNGIWNNFTTTGGSSQLDLTISPPRLFNEADGPVLYGHHYYFVAQVGATFDFAASATVVKRSTTGTVTALNVADDVSLGTVTLGAELEAMICTRIIRAEKQDRGTSFQTFEDYAMPASLINESAIQSLTLYFPGNSWVGDAVSPLDARECCLRLLKLRSCAAPMEIVVNDEDGAVETYYGVITETNYFAETYWDAGGEFYIRFRIYRTDPSDNVPITTGVVP